MSAQKKTTPSKPSDSSKTGVTKTRDTVSPPPQPPPQKPATDKKSGKS